MDLSTAPHFAGVDTSPVDFDPGLEEAVRALPRRQRLAVELRYFLDLSTQESAAVMGCSEGTVKSTLHDAKRKLRTALEAGHGN